MALPEPEFVSVDEAIAILGVTQQRLRWLVQSRYLGLYDIKGNRTNDPEAITRGYKFGGLSMSVKFRTSELRELINTGTTAMRKDFEANELPKLQTMLASMRNKGLPNFEPLQGEMPEQYAGRMMKELATTEQTSKLDSDSRKDLVLYGLVEHLNLSAGEAERLLNPEQTRTKSTSKVHGCRMKARAETLLKKLKEL